MDINPNDIDAYLSSLEYEHNIVLLGAWDTGSHAWGLASPTSDYDITIAYVQPPSNHTAGAMDSIDTDGQNLSTVGDRSSIEPELVELAGWSANRFLELLLDSNPAALEALHSPIIYRGHPLLQDLQAETKARFHIIDLANHYRSMAKRNYQKYISGENQTDQTIKRNLNVIRSCMYAEYVYETHELPPLDYRQFLQQAPDKILHPWDLEEIHNLIDEKRAGNGDTTIGNPFQQSILQKLADLQPDNHNPQDHIREEGLSADTLRETMRSLVQSRLLSK